MEGLTLRSPAYRGGSGSFSHPPAFELLTQTDPDYTPPKTDTIGAADEESHPFPMSAPHVNHLRRFRAQSTADAAIPQNDPDSPLNVLIYGMVLVAVSVPCLYGCWFISLIYLVVDIHPYRVVVDLALVEL
jgi:hypothetical protein